MQLPPPLSETSDVDLARMRRERVAKLQAEMERLEVDALVLSGSGNVAYSTGATQMTVDVSRAIQEPTMTVLLRHGQPHLFTAYPEGAPRDLPDDRVHPPLLTEFVDGVRGLADALRGLLGEGAPRVAFDEFSATTFEHLPRLLPAVLIGDAGPALAAAKLCKTDDELECIRRAQRINELAMYRVYERLRPGIRQSDLSGIFLRAIFEFGASGNSVDPIWHPTPRAIADGPYTVNGDVAFPTCSSDRILRQDELIFVDSGVLYEGYSSDFGRTWIVGHRPVSSRERDHCKRWQDVVRRALAITQPGTTGLELTRAAKAGEHERPPWLAHFYLAHGVGTESAEMPFVGSDLGDDFDDGIVLQPGMVLVFEPVIWDDGYGGYRSEEIVAVTDDGYRMLSDFPYMPFDEDVPEW